MICNECETVAHCTSHGCIPKTTKKDEALKLALEALARLHYEQYTHQGEKAITALREALAEQPAQQEPVAKHYVDGGHLVYPPAQRTWVGLTDEERDDLLDNYITAEGRARAIEAKLKEKNNAM